MYGTSQYHTTLRGLPCVLCCSVLLAMHVLSYVLYIWCQRNNECHKGHTSTTAQTEQHFKPKTTAVLPYTPERTECKGGLRDI